MKLTYLAKYIPLFIAVAILAPAQSTKAQTRVLKIVQPPQTQTVVPTPATTKEGIPTYGSEYAYDRYMRLGYAATQRKDHQAALSYFKLALQERPNDRYANIAYWNMVDTLKAKDAPSTNKVAENNYQRYMRIGYDATNQRDYQTALINFKRALKERPGDFYASQALRNVQTYTNRGRQIARD
ncbi:MAG: hypothetical protein WBB28_07880 [Crinalium sp.]